MEPTLVAAPPKPASLRDTVLTRRNFLWLAAGSAAGLAFYAGEIARHELEIVYLYDHPPRLPDAFAGMKIVQISDFHFQEYTEAAFLEAIVRQVNAVAPDLVVLTGDFVSTKPLPRHFSVKLGYHCAELLSRIKCPLRYAILGNHDSLVSAHAVTDAFTPMAFPCWPTVLCPWSAMASASGSPASRMLWRQRPDLAAALPAGRRPDQEPLILLAHEPDFADYAVGRQVDLVLSGHTHGGQIRLPFLPPLFLPEWEPNTCTGFSGWAMGCSSMSIEASVRSPCRFASAARRKLPSSPCNLPLRSELTWQEHSSPADHEAELHV